MTEEKVLENKIRRMLKRRRMLLMKSRRRDPNAYDFGGYMVVDADTNSILFGSDPLAFSATLADIQNWMK